MTYMTRTRFAVLILSLLSVAGWCIGAPAAVAGAAPGDQHFVNLQGTYIQPPVVLTNAHLTGSATTPFAAEGGTTWHGDLEGETSFVMHGIIDLDTLVTHGVNDETFTGSVRGIGTGHLMFVERFTIASSGELSIDAAVVGGDGDLANVRGHMHFVGTSDPSGAGTGTYTATLHVTG